MRSYDPDLLRKEGTKVYIDSSSVKDNAHSGWRCKTRIVVAAVKELGSYACLKIKNLSGRRGKIWGLLRGIVFFKLFISDCLRGREHQAGLQLSRFIHCIRSK